MLHRVTPQPQDMNPEGLGKSYLRTLEWISNILYILSSLYLGVALLLLPWMWAWDNNYLLYIYPQIRPIVANPFFKGAVLGLGIVNISISIHEFAKIRRASKNCLPREAEDSPRRAE
jgi:hypothetical protein